MEIERIEEVLGKYENKKEKEKTGIKSSREKSIKRWRRNKLELQSSHFSI